MTNFIPLTSALTLSEFSELDDASSKKGVSRTETGLA